VIFIKRRYTLKNIKNKLMNKKLFPYLILFLVLSLSIGYSAFSSTLNITGFVADVRVKKDVRITGVSVAPETGGNTDVFYGDINLDGNVDEIDLNYLTKYIVGAIELSDEQLKRSDINGDGKIDIGDQANLKVQIATSYDSVHNNGGTVGYTEYNVNNIQAGITLPNQNSSVTFNVEITNIGNAEVGILEITNLPGNLDYELVGDYKLKDKICDEQGKCTLGIKKIVQIKIKYKDDYILEEGSNKYFDIIANFNFQQFYTVAYKNIQNTKSCTLSDVDNNGKYSVGDIITCNIGYTPDKFYVIEEAEFTSPRVQVLTEYNISTTEYRQSANAEILDDLPGSYWSDSNGNLNPEYGDSYPAEVYEGNDKVKPIVEEYLNYLNIKLLTATGKLITYEQLRNLGCSESTFSCKSAPSWVYSTSYMTGSAADPYFLWSVVSDGVFYYGDSDYNYVLGIRPVVTIPTNQINVNKNELPTETIGGDTLIVDFGEIAPNSITIKINDKEIANYTYKNGIATIPDVNGNVTISNGFKNTYSGTYLTLNDEDIIDYKIYGNTVQNGTPTPELPADIKSIGNLITDSSNSNYGKYEIPIKVSGKNLFNIDNLNGYKNVINNSDGTITVSKYAAYSGNKLKQLCPEMQVGDTITFNMTTQGHDRIYLLEDNSYWEKGKRKIVTQTMLDSKIYFYTAVNAHDTPVLISNIQFEKGTLSTPYEPYKEPIITNIYLDQPLRKIGNYIDYIDFKEGKVVRNTAGITLKGTENWGMLGLGNYYFLIVGEYGDIVDHSIISSHFQQDTIAVGNENTGVDIVNSSGFKDARILVRPGVSSITTLALWKEFILGQYNNSTPLVLNYALSVPTEQTIELPKIITHSGTSIITAEGAELQLNTKSK